MLTKASCGRGSEFKIENREKNTGYVRENGHQEGLLLNSQVEGSQVEGHSCFAQSQMNLTLNSHDV